MFKSLFTKTGLLALGLVAALIVATSTVATQQAAVIFGLNSGVAKAITTDASGNLNVLVSGGTVTPTFPLLAPDGTAAAPSYSWTNNTNMGLFRVGANDMGVSVAGSKTVDFLSTGTTFTGQVLVPVGSIGAPSYSFSGDTGTGIFHRGAGIISFQTNPASTPSLEINNGTVVIPNNNDLFTSAGSNQGNILIGGIAPTISSGFGTSPSVPNGINSAAFVVNVGTGGTASSGVIAMNRTAAAGWVCSVEDITAQAANAANVHTVQTASSTTTVTVQNQTISTGVAVAWTQSDLLRLSCFGF